MAGVPAMVSLRLRCLHVEYRGAGGTPSLRLQVSQAQELPDCVPPPAGVSARRMPTVPA